jgi:RHS repeat-associated protein
VLSRLDNLAADGSGTTKYAQYTYLGAGTIAKVAHPAVTGGLNLVYDPDADDSFDGFDRFGRVVDQRWQNSTPTVKDQFKYGYDRASNRTWREVAPNGGNPTGFDEYYTYDGLHRLEKAERGTLAGSPYSSITSHTKRQDFGLEALGNWREFKDDAGDGSSWDLDQDRTHNAVNETTGVTGGSWIVPGYDAAGNMTSGPVPGDEDTRQHHVWDAWNRLVQVKADNNGSPGTLVVTYRYDGRNHRIRKLLGTDPGDPDTAYDYYYNESWQIVEVRKDSDTDPYEQYVWDVRYIDAPVVRFRDGNTDGDLVDEGDDTLYYTNDANMNVTALVETDGDVVERYTYDPYGNVTIWDDDWSDEISWANSKQNHILYSGYYFDDESGLYSVRHRYYHPTLGRWLSRDPVGYADVMSLYEYVRSRPTTILDPRGLYGENTHWAGTWFHAVNAIIDAWLEQRAYYIELRACIPFARDIADANWACDDDARNALKAVAERNVENYNLHFPGAASESSDLELGRLLEQKLNPVLGGLDANALVRQMVSEAVEDCNVTWMGEALHALQDSYAHEGKPDVGGHPKREILEGAQWDPATMLFATQINEDVGGTWVPGGGLLDTQLDEPKYDPKRHARAMADTRRALKEFWDACLCRLCGQ